MLSHLKKVTGTKIGAMCARQTCAERTALSLGLLQLLFEMLRTTQLKAGPLHTLYTIFKVTGQCSRNSPCWLYTSPLPPSPSTSYNSAVKTSELEHTLAFNETGAAVQLTGITIKLCSQERPYVTKDELVIILCTWMGTL